MSNQLPPCANMAAFVTLRPSDFSKWRNTMKNERRVGDWIKFHCGDLVCDQGDERHIGEIETIWSTCLAKVRWQDSGWVSIIPLTRLRRAP
jgi:alpha-D-ribose 1-methylphosphonate 5-triphosphate synthase subunit PhnH